jgi:hypothetical protein
MDPIVLKREELYAQVWTEPVRKVAARLGVSDVGLAKACRKLRVPLPKRGYWARVAAGQAPRKPLLPQARPGEPAEYRVTAAPPRPVAPGVTAAIDKELLPENLIVIQDVLREPHALVAEAQAALAKARPTREGLLQRLDRRCLDIRVSPAQLDRALRIMDALLKAFVSRGYEVETTPPARSERRDAYDKPLDPEHPPQTRVNIGEHVIGLALYEDVKFVSPPAKRPPSSASYEEYERWSKIPVPPKAPTGSLTLTMKDVHGVGRLSWSDGKRKRLETCLNSFVRALIRASEALEQQRLEADAQARKWKLWQEERDRKAREELERAEREKVLQQQLSGWRMARDVRGLVAEARGLIAQGKGEPTAETDAYLKWALTRAAQADPLTKLREKAGGEFASPGSGGEDEGC